MSIEPNDESSELPSSSVPSIHSSKHNKNIHTSSATNRISPPPNLTINQFQPVFKEARKKKQELNTKTNDVRKNLDQTLFNTQHDNNYSECNISSEPNSSKFKDENRSVCSTNVSYSDGSIKCNILGKHHQLNTPVENKKTDAAVLDHTTFNPSFESNSLHSELNGDHNVKKLYEFV